jgi:hypothetical protein
MIGLDIAKSAFHVHRADERGANDDKDRRAADAVRPRRVTLLGMILSFNYS